MSAGDIVVPVDLLLIADAPRMTDCSNGCDIWLKGALQSMLISLDDEGKLDSKPTLLQYDLEFKDLYQVRLDLDPGYALLKIGNYYYGTWVLDDGSLAFGTTSVRNRGGEANMIGGSSFGTDDCPDSTSVVGKDCKRLANGTIHISLKEYVRGCNGALKQVVITQITIPAKLDNQVSCSF